MEESMPSVLYVAGLGRSGSTIIERAIAQISGVVGVGELIYLWDRGIQNNERCGCGEAFLACGFWTKVGDAAFGGWDSVDIVRMRELIRRVDDVANVPHLLFHSSRRFKEELAEYLYYYERLYGAIQQVSGCSVIVDSSKITSLAYVLSHSPDISLSVLHLLRDPRAVAYSWTKFKVRPEVTAGSAYMPRFRPSYVAALYNGHHFLLEALWLRRVESMRLRYEDFVDEPERWLEEVAHFAGRPGVVGSGLVAQDDSGQIVLGLPAAHTVSGNPSRFVSGDVVLRKDDAWRQKMSPRQKVVVGSLTLPSRLVYGYLKEQESDVSMQSAPSDEHWPTVTAIVPTHDRPELMNRAVQSIVKQDYAGTIETLVVYDKADPDETLVQEDDPRRPVRVLRNVRTPGLAGARNSGIEAAHGELVAFCDDDDHWEPMKLRRQVGLLCSNPDAEFATTAMVVDYEDRSSERLAHQTSVSYTELLRSRMAMLHSSSFLARREAMLDGIGLVDETIPQSMAEDWDLLLRAAERRPIVHLDEPLVRVQWGPTSYFADRWKLRNEAQLWLLERHPGFGTDRRAAGLTYGKLAYGCAMVGDRRQALRWARRAIRANWREPRAYLAAAVAVRLLDGQWLLGQLNRRGHGI